MSRGAEDNFDLGIRINVDSTRLMLEQARACGGEKPVKFIFTSSIAVFGGPLVRVPPGFHLRIPCFNRC